MKDNENVLERLEALCDDLMPISGNAGTIEGEIIRAINRIFYRFYNDGDYFHLGYGCETAGPAMTFLMTSDYVPKVIRDFANKTYNELCVENYEDKMSELLSKIVEYVESKNGSYVESDINMFSVESMWKDDDYDDDYDDYDEWEF